MLLPFFYSVPDCLCEGRGGTINELKIYSHSFRSSQWRCSVKKVFLKISVLSTTSRSSLGMYSVEKSFLRNFTKFTGKHLCQVLFFINLLLLSRVLDKTALTNSTFKFNSSFLFLFIELICEVNNIYEFEHVFEYL